MTVKAAVLSILVYLAGFGVGVEASCPDPDDILPCVCTDDETFGAVMDCSGVEDEPELAEVFATDFNSTHFYELRIYHDPTNLDQHLNYLERTTLGEATFERVVISGTQIISIDGYTFDESRSTLQLLSLGGNRVNEFPFGSLARYTNLTTLLLANNNLELLPQVISDTLETLDVQGNNPMVVQSNAFSASPSLRKIDFSRTGQQSLEPGLFVTLEHLQELDLSDNALTELEESAIVTAAASITFLDLSKNEISFVRHDAIVGLAPTGILYMEDNAITDLTQNSWEHIFAQLSPDGTINLAENPVTCGCDMKWVIHNESYLNLLTDTTKCSTGEIIIFINPIIFDVLCP